MDLMLILVNISKGQYYKFTITKKEERKVKVNEF